LVLKRRGADPSHDPRNLPPDFIQPGALQGAEKSLIPGFKVVAALRIGISDTSSEAVENLLSVGSLLPSGISS
jgi:hypothetical protein